MAGLLGAVGPFERDTDDWTAYCERLQQFFVANEIKEDGKKRAVLLSVCGTASYQLIRSLVAPSKPTDKSVDEIMKLVKDHLTPQPSSIVQRFKFNSRSQQVVRVLRNLFSTHGLPDVIVSDNGTAFTSVEFETFMKRNGIRHARCAPYHPSSNGLAERAVQTFS